MPDRTELISGTERCVSGADYTSVLVSMEYAAPGQRASLFGLVSHVVRELGPFSSVP